MTLPLDGITVVALEQAIAAPMATRHLADWGARVIKVERPDVGDFARGYDKVMQGMSSQFVWTNRTKESVALDFKTEAGRCALDALLEKADVFLQNLAPGAAKKLGLDAKSLVARHPSLIACDISGYGSTGPYRSKKAYDLLVQCETGFLSINGTQESQAKCGLSIVDIATGMYALNGILMALYRRERTGAGTAFEVSLFDSMAEWMSYPAYYTRDSGAPLARAGARHATIAPYGPFKAGDGKAVFFGIQNEREWQGFCARVLEDTAIAVDSRFNTNPNRLANHAELEAVITERFAKWSSEEVAERLEAASIANARLNDVAEFLQHPQLHERDRIRTVDSPVGPLQVFKPPLIIDGIEPVLGPVPAVGEHTDRVLVELGLSETAQESESAERSAK
ncbi:CaiB/BaiF CoA transferase family protein [Cupriavidus sp. P-10]|uniref:CaiB/BaiF CoA transferase family protein n=1 Tax=Cupriavidus sp. P-10 TaxID=2027911 RepID=UPI000E2EBC08|nr:CaiB/BaiF CoA-transferase family protein [Cupriavidus sp. P-10]